MKFDIQAIRSQFIAEIGKNHPDTLKKHPESYSERRKNIVSGMLALENYEIPLADYFKEELAKIEGLKLYCPPKNQLCTSTISFRLKDIHPLDVARHLAAKGIFVWAGGFYAVGLMRTLRLNDIGGMVRIGLAPYNTREEIDRTLTEIRNIEGISTLLGYNHKGR